MKSPARELPPLTLARYNLDLTRAFAVFADATKSVGYFLEKY
jgi:hypothetical protein